MATDVRAQKVNEPSELCPCQLHGATCMPSSSPHSAHGTAWHMSMLHNTVACSLCQAYGIHKLHQGHLPACCCCTDPLDPGAHRSLQPHTDPRSRTRVCPSGASTACSCLQPPAYITTPVTSAGPPTSANQPPGGVPAVRKINGHLNSGGLTAAPLRPSLQLVPPLLEES